jgi:polysaccharide chain length determinant protein (PEP-CTERM system associated)
MNSIEVMRREDQSGTALVREYAAIAWRNKWLLLSCLGGSIILAVMYCIFAPQYYISETLMLAEERNLLDSNAQITGEGALEQRIFLVQRQILNRNFLGPIIREFNLYPDERSEGDEEAAVQQFAKAIFVEMIKKDRAGNFFGRGGVDAFTISFMHEDPAIAMQVTGRIAQHFIEENTKEREKSAEGTSEFLDDEVRTMKLELEKKEDQISRFKSAHIGELPQQTDANLRALDRLQSDINAVNEGLQRHSDRLAMLDRAVQDYRLYGRQNPAFSRGPIEPDPLFHQLKELRQKLVMLKAEFNENYPEVILTKEELRQVEQELVEMYGPDSIKPEKLDSKTLDPYLQDLLKQQSEEKSELGLLRQRQQTLHASKKDYEKRVDKFPEVEQELLILERDYHNMKTNYAMLLDKRLHARVSQNMEKRQQGGKFRIIDPPSFPKAPSIPNKPKVLVFGFLFGCMLGVGASVMRERLTPQFRGVEDVELVVGPQFLAAIPDFSFLWDPTKRNRYSPGAYLNRRPLRSIGTSNPEFVAEDRLERYSRNEHSTDRRFVAKLFPRSMAAEQYRVAAARLQLSTGGTAVAVVTSAIKGEGKTTTVINLGYTLARDFGKRVLLVDCDFVYPEMKCFLERPIQSGLMDYLRGNVTLDDAIVSFAEIPCWIMPAGVSGVDPIELLKTDQLERVLSEMRKRFDYILLNCPPILPVATMNVLEKHADFLLLTVRANLTSQQVVRRALASLRGAKPIHVILNGVASQSLPYYMTEYSVVGAQQPY